MSAHRTSAHGHWFDVLRKGPREPGSGTVPRSLGRCGVSERPLGVRAWDDSTTRRAARQYGLRALGLAVLCLPLFLLGAQFVNDNGDTKESVTVLVPGAFIVAALLALLFGALSLCNWARIRWILTRWPWRTMQSHLEEINGFGTPKRSACAHARCGRSASGLDTGCVQVAMAAVRAVGTSRVRAPWPWGGYLSAG
jgi:hypothetical protein